MHTPATFNRFFVRDLGGDGVILGHRKDLDFSPIYEPHDHARTSADDMQPLTKSARRDQTLSAKLTPLQRAVIPNKTVRADHTATELRAAVRKACEMILAKRPAISQCSPLRAELVEIAAPLLQPFLRQLALCASENDFTPGQRAAIAGLGRWVGHEHSATSVVRPENCAAFLEFAQTARAYKEQMQSQQPACAAVQRALDSYEQQLRFFNDTHLTFLADFSAALHAFPDLPDFILNLFEYFATRSRECLQVELPGVEPVATDIAATIQPVDEALRPANPPKEGRAYYLNEFGRAIRKLPDLGVPNDRMEESKEFFQCTKPSFLTCAEPQQVWLFGLFCMQHGTCVGFHLGKGK